MKINKERILQDIKTLETFNETPGEGVTRSAYSKEERAAKAYLMQEMAKLELAISEDGIGTLFGRKEGTDKNAPVVMIGSHYDSVVNGGAYDGVVGTVAALEVMRVLLEMGIKNRVPVELIAMNAEEGETFGPSTGVSNSRGIVGTLTEEELDSVKNRFGQTKREAMQAYGLAPDLASAKRKPGSIQNFIEMHIEQGPVLELEGKTIGLVEFLPGIGRFRVIFNGVLADSTTALHERKDALLAASLFTAKVHDLMASLGDGITGSVNALSIEPNSNQFIASYVEAKVEIRTFSTELLEQVDIKQRLTDIVQEVETQTNVQVELREMRRIGYPNPTPPSVMDAGNVQKMAAICQEHNYEYMILNNGTGHDSMIMTDFAATNMIYVPSHKGISHNPEEYTDIDDIAAGAQVLLELVLQLCQ